MEDDRRNGLAVVAGLNAAQWLCTHEAGAPDRAAITLGFCSRRMPGFPPAGKRRSS
jgi:hypothetical protein